MKLEINLTQKTLFLSFYNNVVLFKKIKNQNVRVKHC